MMKIFQMIVLFDIRMRDLILSVPISDWQELRFSL